MALTPFLASIRQLIAENKLDGAIQQLHTLLENTPRLDEILQQSGRNAALKEHIRLGLVSFEKATLTENQIRLGLLELITEIENEGAKPELKAETERAVLIVNSKNVVGGNNNVGGNMYVGDTTHIHYHSVGEIPRLLTPPPFVPEIFIGRTDDLQRIYELLFAPNGNLLLLVNGEGGVGKTSIASKYFHTYQEEYAHAAWVFKDNSIADALLLLAVPLRLKFEDFWDNTQRLEELLQAMANLKKPCLLIIDNANDIEDLDEHYLRLRSCSNFHLLLTTRINEYEYAETFYIGGLPEDKALELFEKLYRKLEPEELDLFAQIRAAVGNNTLVLELMAKNLKAVNNDGLENSYELTDLLIDLQNKGLLALTQSEPVNTQYQPKKNKLRREKAEDIIAAMYNLSDLTPEESNLLAIFSVLPAESIPYLRLKELFPDTANLQNTLLLLGKKGWIEFNKKAKSFKCSPVVQEVVRMKQADLLENCASLISALCTKLERENLHHDNYQHSMVFVRYAEAILNSLSYPNYDLTRLSSNIGNYYTATGDLSKAMTAYSKMKAIMTDLYNAQPDNPDFKNGLAISFQKLGVTHIALGNLQQALTFFEHDNVLNEELYTAYPQNVEFKNGLAISYTKLGETHSTLGNLQQALTFFEKRNQLGEELYAAYPQNVAFKNGLAISYEKLGETRSDLGNLQQALTFFEKMNQLFEELYATYPQNVAFKNGLAISYSKLGSSHSALGNLQRALNFFEKRNQLGEELYAVYPQNVAFKNGLAISYEKLGETHNALGNLQWALNFFEKRNQLGEELYAAYPQNVDFKNGLAISYLLLGQFYEQQLQNQEKARAYYLSTRELLEALVENFPGYVDFKTNLDWVTDKLAQ